MSTRKLWIITIVPSILCWGVLIAAYGSVTNQVHSTSGDIHASYDLFGIPLIDGFRVAGRLGLKFGWGAALLLVGPFVIGMVLALWQITHYTRTRPAEFEQG